MLYRSMETLNRTILQKVAQDEDLDKLRKIASGILGEPCWQASLSYGDELSLDIGARIPCSRSRGPDREKGAWILGTRGSDWKLEYLGKIIATQESDSEIGKQRIKEISGAAIAALETRYPDLVLTVLFSKGYKLMVFPDIESDLDLSYWELFTPDHMLLEVKPGPLWSYRPSDLPVNAACQPLAGRALLKKLQELSRSPRPLSEQQTALSCGYYRLNEKNELEANLTAFDAAVLAAKLSP